jgi:hypothetical protein
MATDKPPTIAPWILTLVLSLAVQVAGAAFITGAVISRLDAMAGRIDRLERQIDEVMGVGTRGFTGTLPDAGDLTPPTPSKRR